MKRKWVIVCVILLIFLIGCAMIGPIMSDVEQPKYDVISSSGNIELRQYAPMVIAVKVAGARKAAINAGFRMLADFIFGNNTVQQSNEKIPMTAPVQQQEENGAWKVNFVMPAEYRIDDLPKPNNEQVKLKEIPAKKFVVVTFSGMNSEGNLQKHEAQLNAYIKENNLPTLGSLKYAFYNPPWTLPFLRRNEIMQEIE